MAINIDFRVKNGLAVTTTATVEGTTQSTSTVTGALIVAGGVGIGKDLWVGGTAYANGSRVLTTSTVSPLQQVTEAGNSTTNVIQVLNATASTSTNSGALIVTGGVGVAGDIYANAVYANELYDNSGRVITTSTLQTYGVTSIAGGTGVYVNTATGFVTVTNIGVQTLTAGTDTVVSSSTGTVTVWNNSTLQSVTSRGNTTNRAIGITNTASSTSTDTGNALYVDGGVWIAKTLNVQGDIVGSTATVIQITGNSGQFFGDAQGFGALYAGIPNLPGIAPSTVLQLDANINDYAQTNFQNVNNGPGASVDWVASSGSTPAEEFSNYIDMGITSGNWDGSQEGSLGLAAGPNDGYLYAQGNTSTVGQGNLIIGAISSGSVVRFFVGGPGAQSLVAKIDAPNTVSTSSVTGSFVLTGGAGISGNINVGGAAKIAGITTVTNTTAASSTITGALQVAGGAGIGGNLYVGANIVGLSTAASTTTVASNALYIAGGVGIAKTLLVTGEAVFQSSVIFSGTTTYVLTTNTVYTDNIIELHYPNNPGNAWTVNDGKSIGTRFHYYDTQDRNAFLGRSPSGYLEWLTDAGTDGLPNIDTGTYGTFKLGSIVLDDTTSSTSPTSGALIVAGGVGIGGDLRVGGTIYGYASVTGIITTATNVSAGTAGQLVYQSTSGVTSFAGPGTVGQLLMSSGTNAPVYVNTSNITVAYSSLAVTATNVATGTAGQIVYQTARGVTGFVNTGAIGTVLVSNGTSSPAYQNTLTLAGNAVSTSTDTGALQVVGGVGVGGNLNVGGAAKIAGITTVTNTTNAISTNSGALQVAGGAGVGRDLYVGGLTNIAGIATVANITNATSTNSGALQVYGGVGVGRDLYVGGNSNVIGNEVITGDLTVSGGDILTGATTFNLVNTTATIVNFAGAGTAITIGASTGYTAIKNATTITNTTAASSTITGALQVVGGVGIGGNLYVGGTIVGFGSITGVISTATNIAGGATGYIPIQSGAGTTVFINPGSVGNLLQQQSGNTATFVSTSTLIVGYSVTATNIALGTAGQMHYQSAAGVTGFVNTGAIGTVLVSNGTSAPAFQNTLTLAGTTNATNTTTGALQVVGGVGIGQDLYVGGNETITGNLAVNGGSLTTNQSTFNLVNTAATTVNFAGAGTAVTIGATTGYTVLRNLTTLTNTANASSTVSGALQVVGGVGIGGNLYVGGTITSAGNITGTASTATNIAGGAPGVIPIQVAAGITAFISTGSVGSILQMQVGNTATFVSTGTFQIGYATNIAGGTAGQLHYQSAPSTTAFVNTGTIGTVLVSNGTSAPVYQNTLTLAGTANASSTTTGALQVVGGVGVGGTIVSTGLLVLSNNVDGNTTAPPLDVQGAWMRIGDATTSFTATNGVGIKFHDAGNVHYSIASTGTNFVISNTSVNGNQLLPSGRVDIISMSTTGIVTIPSTQAANSTSSGALQVYGGVGIGRDLYVGGIIYGVFSGSVTGTASTATNITGGSAGAIPIQTGNGTTAFINTGSVGNLLQQQVGNTATFVSTSTLIFGYSVTATNIALGTAGQLHYQSAAGVTSFAGPGTAGQLLMSSGTSAPIYVNTASLVIGYSVYANTATNITGGTVGSLPYQNGTGTTTMLALSTAGYVLLAGATAPQWASLSSIVANTATNVAGGLAGQLHYQSAPGTTAFVSTGTAGTVLVSGGSGSPVYQNTLTLAGTATSISTTTGALQVVGGIGVGGSIYVGNRVGFVNASNVSTVYQYYNAATNSLDTVFA